MGKSKALTALRVEKAVPNRRKGEPVTTRVKDGEVPGLYLQIGPNGSKSWLYRFQIDKRERFMGIGSFPTFKLAEAREQARLLRQHVQKGEDPIEMRRNKRDADAKAARERITFRDAAEEFFGVFLPTFRNEKHRKQWRTTIERYAYPKLKDRSVAAIDDAMVNDCIVGIQSKTPETARRVKDRILRVVDWVKTGKPMPMRNGNGKRHHPALPWQEVPTFMGELRERDSVSARALEFLILTASRTGEVVGMQWSEVDLKNRLWTVPPERMKSLREHRVPLSDRAVEILKGMPTERGNDFVFIGGKAGEGLSNMAMLELLRGMRDKVTVHGFRSSFVDWAHETTNHPRTVVEAALAHVVGDRTEASYRRGDLFAKRTRLMADWSKYCASKAAEVVGLRPKKRRLLGGNQRAQ